MYLKGIEPSYSVALPLASKLPESGAVHVGNQSKKPTYRCPWSTLYDRRQAAFSSYKDSSVLRGQYMYLTYIFDLDPQPLTAHRTCIPT